MLWFSLNDTSMAAFCGVIIFSLYLKCCCFILEGLVVTVCIAKLEDYPSQSVPSNINSVPPFNIIKNYFLVIYIRRILDKADKTFQRLERLRPKHKATK